MHFSEISVSIVIFDCWNFPESYNIYVIEYIVIERFLSSCPASECVELFDSKNVFGSKSFSIGKFIFEVSEIWFVENFFIANIPG